MTDEDGISVQFCYLPDLGLFGKVLSQSAYYLTVLYSENGIEHEEIFGTEEVILMKEVFIPITKEEEEH